MILVFEILNDLQKNENKTIIMVEQNAKKGLEFADLGYVLSSGKVVLAGDGNDLLNDDAVGKLFFRRISICFTNQKKDIRLMLILSQL